MRRLLRRYLRRFFDVCQVNPSRRAAPVYGCQIDAQLARPAAGDRRSQGEAFSGAPARFQNGHRFAAGDGRPLVDEALAQDAGGRRLVLQRRFIAFKFKEDVSFLDGVSLLLQPAGQGRFFHRQSELGHDDFHGASPRTVSMLAGARVSLCRNGDGQSGRDPVRPESDRRRRSLRRG